MDVRTRQMLNLKSGTVGHADLQAATKVLVLDVDAIGTKLKKILQKTMHWLYPT